MRGDCLKIGAERSGGQITDCFFNNSLGRGVNNVGNGIDWRVTGSQIGKFGKEAMHATQFVGWQVANNNFWGGGQLTGGAYNTIYVGTSSVNYNMSNCQVDSSSGGAALLKLAGESHTITNCRFIAPGGADGAYTRTANFIDVSDCDGAVIVAPVFEYGYNNQGNYGVFGNSATNNVKIIGYDRQSEGGFDPIYVNLHNDVVGIEIASTFSVRTLDLNRVADTDTFAQNALLNMGISAYAGLFTNGDWSTTNDEYTCSRAGTYKLSLSGLLRDLTAGTAAPVLRVFKNGNTGTGTKVMEVVLSGTAANTPIAGGPLLVTLAATDTLKLYQTANCTARFWDLHWVIERIA